MSSRSPSAIVIGGEPRIDFLPPEIRQRKDARRRFRVLLAVVVGVVTICLAAYAGVTTIAVSRQVALLLEQERTIELITEQGRYVKARDAAATVETARDARLVASAPEILWREQLPALQATLPEGAAITQYSVAAQSATNAAPVPEGALALPLVAQVTLGATFATVESVAAWQDSLVNLPGFAGVWVTPITDIEGVYHIQASIGIFTDAFALRLFSPVADEADAAAETVESGT